MRRPYYNQIQISLNPPLLKGEILSALLLLHPLCKRGPGGFLTTANIHRKRVYGRFGNRPLKRYPDKGRTPSPYALRATAGLTGSPLLQFRIT
jgi:hypothetical protein